jgi:hypothetical protein
LSNATIRSTFHELPHSVRAKEKLPQFKRKLKDLAAKKTQAERKWTKRKAKEYYKRTENENSKKRTKTTTRWKPIFWTQEEPARMTGGRPQRIH